MLLQTFIRLFKNKTGKETHFKFYKVMATLTFLYGSEACTINASKRSKMQDTEI